MIDNHLEPCIDVSMTPVPEAADSQILMFYDGQALYYDGQHGVEALTLNSHFSVLAAQAARMNTRAPLPNKTKSQSEPSLEKAFYQNLGLGRFEVAYNIGFQLQGGVMGLDGTPLAGNSADMDGGGGSFDERDRRTPSKSKRKKTAHWMHLGLVCLENLDVVTARKAYNILGTEPGMV